MRCARSRARAVSSRSVMSSPSKTTSPESGSIRPAISEISVDLPLPDTPTRLVVSPRASSRLDVAQDARLDGRPRGRSCETAIDPHQAQPRSACAVSAVRLAGCELPKTSGDRSRACLSSFSASALSSARPRGLSWVRLISSSISCSPPLERRLGLDPADAGREVLVLRAALLDDEHVPVALEGNARATDRS